MSQSTKLLVLEDGKIFRGRSFGAPGTGGGEVVFNTSMMGYPEILTDPSYAGQMVVMSYPMIGNYGISAEDFEARKAFATGLIVKESSRISSNWRSHYSLDEYLRAQNIPGLCDIDTRALVRHLRNNGSMRGLVVDVGTGSDLQEPSVDELLSKVRALPSMAGTDLARGVSAGHIYHWSESAPSLGGAEAPLPKPDEQARLHVVVMDFGVKRSILRQLVAENCAVTVVPAQTAAAEVMELKPSGVLLSNGPGDPEPVAYAVETVRKLIGQIPLFGICLGHQILALAIGARSYKLKFGHRGGNHPVQDQAGGKVEITSHNHGFSIDADSLPADVAEATYFNLNDGTLEGFRLLHAPGFSVQYHPEASPGPHDSNHLFKKFVTMMEEWKAHSSSSGRALG